MLHDFIAIISGDEGSSLTSQAFRNGNRESCTRAYPIFHGNSHAQRQFRAIQLVALRCPISATTLFHKGDGGGTLWFWQVMKRDQKFPPGAHVTWAWGEQILHGIVQKVFTHRIERTMKGATVTRDASKKNPAYLIQLDDGDDIFLNHNDLSAA